jgi:hypothetical protein
MEKFYDLTKIPDEVINLPKNISSRRFAAMKNRYGEVDVFIFNLFFLTFIEKYDVEEISRKMLIDRTTIYNYLYDFRWNYSLDYKENNKKALQEYQKLKREFTLAQKETTVIDFSYFPIYLQAVKKELRSNAYISHGFDTKEEYLKTLYYLLFIIEKPKSTRELSIMLDETIGNTHTRLQSIGFSKSHELGIEIKKRNKNQDYAKTNNQIKLKRIKNLAKKFTTGSTNEDFFRSAISIIIPQYFDNYRYDIVVGLNNTGNLGSKEIDIPIFIWDNEIKQIWKFAVEYNPDYFHTEESDNLKRQIAEEKGWVYIPIIEKPSDNFSGDVKKMEKISIEVCSKIRSLVNHN